MVSLPSRASKGPMMLPVPVNTSSPLGAAGGEQVVHDDDFFPFDHRVQMHLECIFAVFERIGDRGSFIGQLPLFSDRNKSGSQKISERSRGEKPARFDADHLGNSLILK